jgi:hypothetical protein
MFGVCANSDSNNVGILISSVGRKIDQSENHLARVYQFGRKFQENIRRGYPFEGKKWTYDLFSALLRADLFQK